MSEALVIHVSNCQIFFLQKIYRGFAGSWHGNLVPLTNYNAGWILPSNHCFLDILHTHIRTTSFKQPCSEYFPCWEHCVTTVEWEEWVLVHTQFGNLLLRGSICLWKKMPYGYKSLRFLGQLRGNLPSSKTVYHTHTSCECLLFDFAILHERVKQVVTV